MELLTIDLETSVNGTFSDFKADPFDLKNFIVASGHKWSCENSVETTYTHTQKERVAKRDTTIPKLPDNSGFLLVGQNIKFDLLYLLMLSPQLIDNWYRTGGQIWDTMLAEYLLSGQEDKFISLDALSERYGGTKKDATIAAYWDAGMTTESIPKNELLEYLEDDVRNTELVALRQIRQASMEGMLEFILSQMNALLATTYIEFNGMHFSRRRAGELRKDVLKNIEPLEKELLEFMQTENHIVNLAERKYLEWNIDSNIQWTRLLFGGQMPYTYDEVVRDSAGNAIVYKSGDKKGQVKTRKVKRQAQLKPMPVVSSWLKSPGCTLKKGQHASGEVHIKALDEYACKLGYSSEAYIFDKLLEYRGLKKELSTYIDGYTSHLRGWGAIHPSYNHTSTHTGRLSCVRPNLQNVTKKEV